MRKNIPESNSVVLQNCLQPFWGPI